MPGTSPGMTTGEDGWPEKPGHDDEVGAEMPNDARNTSGHDGEMGMAGETRA